MGLVKKKALGGSLAHLLASRRPPQCVPGEACQPGSLASGVPLRVGTLRPVVRVDVFRAHTISYLPLPPRP